MKSSRAACWSRSYGVVGTSGGEVFAVKPDGTKRWSYAVGSSTVESDPVIGADGTVYVGTHEGVLHAITPDGQKLFSQNLPGRVYRQPAIGPDRRLYVSTIRRVDGRGEIRSIGPCPIDRDLPRATCRRRGTPSASSSATRSASRRLRLPRHSAVDDDNHASRRDTAACRSKPSA